MIERILRHCGLWLEPSPRGPPGDCPKFRSTKLGLSPFPTAGDGLVYVPDAESRVGRVREPHLNRQATLADELVYVPDDVREFCDDWDWGTGPSTKRTSESVESGELTFVDEATFWATF